MSGRNLLPTRRYNTEEIIFSEGEPSEAAFIIETGSVEVFAQIDNQEKVLSRLTAGNFFGEISVLDDQPRSASARAVTDTVLTVISKDQIHSRLHQADPVLRLIIVSVLRHFRTEITSRRDSLPVDVKDGLPTVHSDAVDMVRMESELALAIDNDQLYLNYQPIVWLDSQKAAGVEVLIRWCHPERGEVSPGVFMELAETTELVVPLSRWCIQKGLEGLSKIQKATNEPLFISFNIDNKLIYHEEFIPWFTEQVEHFGIPPSQIKLEILERSLIDEAARDWIRTCQSRGFLVVMDDFGTGYSSLSYINQFNFDALKLDRSFVKEITRDTSSLNICRSIVILAQLQGMQVVAEGVEDSVIGDMLRGMGCTYGQGFYYSKPLGIEQLIDYVNDQ